MAADIAALLGSVPELAECDILVDMQKDTAALVQKALAKTSGSAIVVAFTGASSQWDDHPGPRLEALYAAALITQPTLRGAATPAPDLVEIICRTLHRAQLPSPRPTKPYLLHVTEIRPTIEEPFVVHEVILKTTIQL